jgi:Tfp pilus assembly protein PilX
MRTNERGYSLIIAMVIVAILTMLGFAVLDAVIGDVDMASAARQKEAALYVAEGGIAWAVDQVNAAYPSSSGTTVFGDITLSAITMSSVVVQGDASCPTSDCAVLLTPSGWRRLTTTGAVAYGNGEFQTFIRDDDDGDDNSDIDTNGTILLRSIGRSGRNSGAVRVLEVAIKLGR